MTQTVTVDTGTINWMASFRGRLGFAVDRILFYSTGGAAVAEFGGASATVVNGPGIGLPPFYNNWSLAGEYRHTDFGSGATTVNIPDGLGGTFAPVTTNSRFTVDQATARLNYRFGGPVVARY